MLNFINVDRVCITCTGVGVWTEPENPVGGPYVHDPCPRCNGNGYEGFYKLVLPSGYFWATDILNCIVLTEFAGLSAVQREMVEVVLSIGICCLLPGSREFALLNNLFPEGTDTRVNLIALIS